MKVLRRRVVSGALTLAAALLGCGGGLDGPPPAGIMPAPATCGTVLPCGGDPTGTWKVLGGCLAAGDSYGAACGQVQIVTLAFRGTMTLNADMTYTAKSFTEDRAEIDTFPTTCSYPQTTCAQQDMDLKAAVAHLSGGYASCTGSTTCACTVAEAGETVIGEAGSYSVQGNSITFASPSGNEGYADYSYCVQDGFLHLIAAADVVDSSGAQTIVVSQDIVAQLQ